MVRVDRLNNNLHGQTIAFRDKNGSFACLYLDLMLFITILGKQIRLEELKKDIL